MPAHDPATRRTARLARWKRWAAPGAAFALAAAAATVLWGNIRDDVWAYFTDGGDLRVEARDARVRPVLWQDPETAHFAEGGDANAPGAPLEAAFSADGTLMVLVREDKAGHNADLFLSRWDGRVWSKPEPIATLNSPANERGPALSTDGRFLYFASDRPGGLGGTDLYVARWNGSEGTGVEALPAKVNTTAHESGPALSADGRQLYFSSDRLDGEAQDIFVSNLTAAGPDAGALPEFGEAEPVDRLNSKAADVQAALTARGDHVFLASDRDRDGKRGFKVYLSRVVGGEARPPEEVDLYFEQGDVTDPATRMDGFDLLFSANPEADEHGFRLFQSTTREVIAYTDLSRWDQFRELMGNIAWRLLLALAAFLALIYLLEKWRDITSLFHKCLAGSAVLHLLALLFAMLWFVAREIEDDAPAKVEEIVVTVDALAQEELALESVPEETALTDTDTNLETEKVESEFGAPGFEQQEDHKAVPEPAPTTKEAVLVDVRPAMSQPTEQPPIEPLEEASILNALAATTLPEIEAPRLEERDPTEPQPPADPSKDFFEPKPPMREVAKVEPQPMEESAVETPVDPGKVSELQPAEALAGQPKLAAFVESAEVAPETPVAPAEAPALDSALLAALPETTLVDPAEARLETVDPASARAPADPTRDMFDPGEAIPALSIAPAEGGALADAAVSVPGGASAVAADERIPGPPLESVASNPVAASVAPDAVIPVADFPSGVPTSLPTVALVDPGEAMLEGPSQPTASEPADPSRDLFQPGPTAPASTPAENPDVANSARAAPADPASIPVGGSPAISAIERARPSESLQPASQSPVPLPDFAPASPDSLPELVLVEPGKPMSGPPGRAAKATLVDPGALVLETPAPTSAPADSSQDTFVPTSAIPALVTTPVKGGAVPDTAAARPVESTAVADSPAEATSAAPMARTDLAATGSLPNLKLGAPSVDLAAPSLLPLPPLAEKLETPPGMDARALANLMQKQRGKPGLETIKQMGGSDGSELAIGAAMEWFSKNQESDGRWNTQKHGARAAHDLGGTGLALLCYYGWGERHDTDCKYREHVRKGLDWLVSKQRKNGYLGGQGGMMYSHAIATIALTEAYGLTRDPRLKEPAERALAYTLAAQSKSKGGWRYSPGEDSDLSVTGWQYMALHSARMAGLDVPESSFERVRVYLDQMGGGTHGGLYGYQARSQASKAMVATGMFCRQLDLVPPGEPKMQESARLLKMNPMGTNNPDFYYVYYATLALYQHQGPIWQEWNARLLETLPLIQKKHGAEAGSWDPSGGITSEGGRVVSTALATLSLEVYYRLLPMYGFRNADAEAPEAKQRGN